VLNGHGITVLVLAAQRNGEPGALADRFGVSHKCLVPIGGRPLIEHVLLTLSASPVVSQILISIENVDALAGNAMVTHLSESGKLRVIAAQDNIAGSVIGAAEAVQQWPLLITTADNVLFTGDAILKMVQATGNADIAAAFARKDSVLAAHSEGQRRFYQFADDAYSNCNCYWIGSEKALGAANIFREGGQFSKHPMRIARAFGLLNLIRFRLGLGTLEQSFGRFSRRLGLRMKSVIFDDGALAIDVDNDRTYAVAEALLLARQAATEEAYAA
jgi:molybdopterin-guanine dinucleotide biosynthesis protein A